MTELSEKTCSACEGFGADLMPDEITRLKAQISPEWEISSDGKSLIRKFAFKGFAKAVYTANMVAYVCDKEGHHADVAFGWGYCHVTFTSHELDRLSENDFICAAKLDAVV